MYYGIISLCALMFSTQFLFTKIFQKSYGDDLKAMLVSSAGSALVGLIMLFLINGFHFGCTVFALIMAVLTGIDSCLTAYCSLKVLDRANLSVYSMFMMLGGMALPFVCGILFFGERLTAGKAVCFLFIAIALFLTTDKSKTSSGFIYYIGIFVLNGLAGVLAKVYQAAPFEKIPAAEYSILCAAAAFVMSALWLAFIKGEKRHLSAKAAGAICASGILNRTANLLLLICLTYLPASVQYPFITGGSMIFSTLIGCFMPQKPKKREILSVITAFLGLLIMFFVN